MSEQNRLQELYNYKILDTPAEKDLDELVEIASAICDTPISLVSLIDFDRQWFKANKGLDFQESSRKDSFCQYALHNPKEVLVVDDPLQDERFRDSALVQGNPHIRFYAGAPLETAAGNVLGALCIMDNKPRHITESQKKALKLLAKKVMDYLETRKRLIEQNDIIELNAARLKKLTDQAPGAIYQFELRPDGTLSFPFISKGINDLHAHLSPEALKDDPKKLFTVVHPEDLHQLKASLRHSFAYTANWQQEFRIVSDAGKLCWLSANARAEKAADGTVVWYGTFQNITSQKEYIRTLEQILFDISHVMRRPVATMLGLTAAITETNMSEKNLKEYAGHLRTVAGEMDAYIRKLNEDYSALRSDVTEQSQVTAS